MNKKTLTLILTAVFSVMILTSGIIRHDVSEKKYLKLAKKRQFNPVGQVYSNNKPNGSCVLIDEKYVLTAAHLFIESKKRTDTIISRETIIPTYKYNIQFIDNSKVKVILEGKEYVVKRIIIHPIFSDGVKNGFDLALLELIEPCKNVKPALLNNKFDELYSDVVGVGFGASGIANQPQDVKPRNKKIAGQNSIDSIGGDEHLGNATVLYCDFDHPTRSEYNRMGSAKPRSLEYISTGGDSGGGLFRQTGKQWTLLGICSGTSISIDPSLDFSYYGSIMYWTRVSVFNDWISETIGTPASNL